MYTYGPLTLATHCSLSERCGVVKGRLTCLNSYLFFLVESFTLYVYNSSIIVYHTFTFFVLPSVAHCGSKNTIAL